MGPRAAKKKGKKKQVIEEISDNLENDEDLNLMDQNNMGGFDQEQLTAEEREEQIIKTLNANNPQAAHNIATFSFKERIYKVEDEGNHLVFHINIEGNQLLKDSDDARDQEDYWEMKKKKNALLLEAMNKMMKNMEADNDPLGQVKDETIEKKSLRNQFNF
jgi:dynein intermediate chain 1